MGSAHPLTRAAELPSPDEVWAPRSVVRLGLWPAGPVELKAYGILADASRPLDSDLVEPARAVAEGEGPAIGTTEHRGIGFVILHRGTEANWLLVHWWIAGGACAERLYASPLDAPARFAPLDRPLMASVWDLALIDHERRAYARTAMAIGGTREAYLDDVFRQDFC
jgi:hypothetical protein